MLQPRKKSFGHYILLGYHFAGGKNLLKNQLKLIDKISKIDDSILILDDILDNSKIRNGKRCLYKKIGIKKAKEKSNKIRVNSKKDLETLLKSFNLNYKDKLKIWKLFNCFLKNIDKGQKIDKENSKVYRYNKNLEKRYFEMVKLFTGGQIKFGLMIGQILSGNKIDPKLSEVAEQIGVIRQIIDDFEDYFNLHHEPLGDIKNNSNRFPEIIYMKEGGEKKGILDRNYLEIKNLILNKKNRKIMFDYCNKIYEKIDKKLLKKSALGIPNFKKILIFH